MVYEVSILLAQWSASHLTDFLKHLEQNFKGGGVGRERERGREKGERKEGRKIYCSCPRRLVLCWGNSSTFSQAIYNSALTFTSYLLGA